METPISLPDKLFIRAEESAKEHGLSRNQLYAKAVSAYIMKKNVKDKKQIVRKTNEICENIEGKFPMMLIGAGLAALPYWIVFGIDFFEDLHYRFNWLGFALKGLLPVVLSVNSIGLAGAARQWARQSYRKRILLVGLILHATPLLLFFLTLFWMFFLFRI